jgi:hypothetical protein
MDIRAENNLSNLWGFVIKRLYKPVAQTAPEGIEVAIQIKQFESIAVFEKFTEVVLEPF